MASTNTLPVPKLTYLGWQSGHGFLKHRSSFGSVPHVLILHPRDLGLVPFFPIFGRFHVLDPSSNPSFLRSTVPLALLLSVFLQLGASSLHSAARVMSPLVSSFSCPTSSFSNPTVFPFEPVCTSLSNPHLFPFKPIHVPFRFSSFSPRFETRASPFNPADSKGISLQSSDQELPFGSDPTDHTTRATMVRFATFGALFMSAYFALSRVQTLLEATDAK